MNEHVREVQLLKNVIRSHYAGDTCWKCKVDGYFVSLDEDGCCVHCGEEAVEVKIETALRAISKQAFEETHKPKKKRIRAKRTLLICSVCRKKVRRVYAQCDFDHGDYPRCTTFCHFGKCPCGGDLNRADWLKAGIRIKTEPRTFFLNERQEIK